MAQRDTKSTAMKERPSSIKLQTSLSQPAPSNQQKLTRRHLTLPEPLNNNNNNYSQSPAERYATFRSEMLINSNKQQAISPETPPSITKASISPIQPLMNHAEFMNKWHQKQASEIRKKQKHRYVYGRPPSSSVSSPNSLAFTFSALMSSPPSTQLNLPLPSQRNNIQSSMTPIRTIKKENLTERSKTNESRDKIKMFSAV